MSYLHFILFFTTFITTTVAGAFQAGYNPFSSFIAFSKGFPFSFTLMFILLSHELGHYFASKYHNVKVTPPYFIPAPSLIGTFGAFIKIKSPMPDNKVLFDVGIAGPLTGVIVSLPILIYGLSHSHLMIMPKPPVEGLVLGECLLFKFFAWVIWGSLPDNVHIMLHPMAFAGWIGIFVTALNLMPVGQLDGGHISYALLGEYGHSILSRLVIAGLIILGIIAWHGWLFWAILLFILGLHHPMPLDPFSSIGNKRKILGSIAFLIFVLSFTPIPFKLG